MRIAGWSTNCRPNAARCVAWWIARAVASRIPVALPSVQSSRVMLTISMMVRTPRPSSPSSHAVAPSYSTSLEALEWLPSLSFRRWIAMALRVPSGRIRGSTKQDRPWFPDRPPACPLVVCASTSRMSDIGAEVNHLWPVSDHVPSDRGTAVVVLARTSEPPCFSVIDMPAISPPFSSGGRNDGS